MKNLSLTYTPTHTQTHTYIYEKSEELCSNMKILNSHAIHLYTLSQFEFLIDEAIINDKNMNFMRIGWRYIDVVETFSDHLRRSLPLRSLCAIQRKFSATENDLGIFTVLVDFTRASYESNPTPRIGRVKEKRVEKVMKFS